MRRGWNYVPVGRRTRLLSCGLQRAGVVFSSTRTSVGCAPRAREEEHWVLFLDLASVAD